MTPQRWIRIIPVALVMYSISYIDRTNVSLALDGKISTMLRDLAMDDRMKGAAAGIFFLGYFLLQGPGGYVAQRWGPKRLISVCLVLWGSCAMACGLVHSFRSFAVARFSLGLCEASVFPATMVLLANWFPQSERSRASAFWSLCQPLAVVVAGPVTGWCIGAYGWRVMLIAEGALPFLWLPFWLKLIPEHPRDAKWLVQEDRERLDQILKSEAAALEPPSPVSIWRCLRRREMLLLIAVYVPYNSAAYGCMTFFTNVLKGREFSPTATGVLFAAPYLLTIGVMVLNSWHSDRTQERRGHVALVLGVSGLSLVASVLTRQHFWLSYVLMCLAIPGPFSAIGPFFAIPTEIFPRGIFGTLIGMLNAIGNLGGFLGPFLVGWLAQAYHSVAVPFVVLGTGMLASAGVALLLPRTKRAWG